MATEREQPKVWGQKSKIDEELDYFTELALHESERWMQAVTRKKFKYPNDPRRSLEDGILMCELLNGLKPGTIRKVNRLLTPLAGLDNVNVFLEACSKTFGLKDAQLFHPCDLEDLSNRAFADSEEQLKYETDRRLRNVVVTIYWLGRTVLPWYKGPHLDCTAFSDLIGYHHPKVRLTNIESSSENIISEELHSRQESCDSLDRSSGYSSYRGDSKTSSSYSQHHSRQESSDSVDRGSVSISFRNDNVKSSLSSDVFEDDPVTSPLRDESYESFVSEDLPLTRRLKTDNITPDTGETDNMPIPQDYCRRASHVNRLAEHRYSATFDSPYMPPEGATSSNLLSNRWKNSAVYQSTPSLNRDGHDDHNRFRFGDSKLEKQSRASSSSDNIDGLKPNERRNSYLPPGQAARKTSTTHADPMQFVYVGGSKLSEKAKVVIEAMEEQKKITKALEHEEIDWHSNLSSWKSKMRTKNKAVHERTESMDSALEDPEPTRRKSKTFGEMMAERERRKSTGRNFYPYTEEDVGALGGINRLNNTSTTEDSKSLDKNSQNNDSTIARHAEVFESRHTSQTSVKANNDQSSHHALQSPATKSHSRYTVSQNAAPTLTKSQPSNTSQIARDRGREMMERRKEESDNQEFEEKTIKISQKPNGEKGFGFTISGGKEYCSPIVIEKVSLGSAADAFQLMEGDEILAINGVAMDDSYQGSVTYVINQAVRTGVMELKIRRYPFAESDESDAEAEEKEQERLRQEALERQRQEEEEQRLRQEKEQEEERRRELEEQQRQEKQREEQLRLEQLRQLKRQQLEKQREELRQQKLQQLEQQRLQQQKQQEPLPRRRRHHEQRPQEQQLIERLEEKRQQKQKQKEQQDIEQQQELEQQQMEHQWVDKQEQQQLEQQQQKEQQWQERQQQEQQQQELEQKQVEQQQQQQQEQQQWEQMQQEQQQWEQKPQEQQQWEQKPQEQQQWEQKPQEQQQWEQKPQEQQQWEQKPQEQQQWEQKPHEQQQWVQKPHEQQQWEQNPQEHQQQWEQQQLEAEQQHVQLQLEEQQLLVDARQEDMTASHSDMDYYQMELPEVPSEPPPPLPSMPPPAPNWNTFPAATGEPASTNDDFFDPNDLLPDLGMGKISLEEKTAGREELEVSANPEAGCVRKDILRRKSQFLGLERCEEYHTLQTDKQHKEKIEWQRIEASDSILKDLRHVADTRPTDNSWQLTEGATYDLDSTSHSSLMSQSTSLFSPSSAYDLEQGEMEIIANLERGEEASRQLANNHDCCHDNSSEGDVYQDRCSSRSTDSSTVASIEARVTQDMLSTPSVSRPPHRTATERRMLDLEEERRRMERWDAEQEEKRKQQYEAEQQRIRKTHEVALKKSNLLEEERLRELAAKEEAQQQKFDELRRQAEIENQRQQEEQEKIRQQEEKRRIRQQEQERILAEREEERKREEAEREAYRKREEADREARKKREEAEREAQRKREEAERVRKQAEEQHRWQEEERARMAQEEDRRREEERVQKMEEEQVLQKEREEKVLWERKEELRLMEERLQREKEKFRLDKERFEMEKSNRQKPWNIQQSNTMGYDTPPGYDAPPVPVHTMPPCEDVKLGEVRLGYVPRNNAYPGQYEPSHEPNHKDVSPTSQPQFHIEFKTEPNRIFTLHQQPDNDYSYHGNNGVSPRAPFEKLPHRELPIQPKPSLREEMGLGPQIQRHMYSSQSNVAVRSPTGSDVSLPDTGREAALRSSRLPSGISHYYPARDGEDGGTRRHSEYQRRPEPSDDVSTKSLPPWADSLKPVTSSSVTQSDQVSPTHLSKAELHQIAAVPRPRFNDNWIKPAEERQQRRPVPRRSEIMQQNISHPGEHWLFEEAERRRLASQQGAPHLQKRWPEI